MYKMAPGNLQSFIGYNRLHRHLEVVLNGTVIHVYSLLLEHFLIRFIRENHPREHINTYLSGLY